MAEKNTWISCYHIRIQKIEGLLSNVLTVCRKKLRLLRSEEWGGCVPYVITASVALRCLSAWQEDPPSLSVRAAASGFLLSSADSHTIEPTDQVLEKSSCHTSTLHISIADENNWRFISSFSLHRWRHRARIALSAKDFSLSTPVLLWPQSTWGMAQSVPQTSQH